MYGDFFCKKRFWKTLVNLSEFELVLILYFYLDKLVMTLGYIDMNMQRELVWIRLSDKLVK